MVEGNGQGADLEEVMEPLLSALHSSITLMVRAWMAAVPPAVEGHSVFAAAGAVLLGTAAELFASLPEYSHPKDPAKDPHALMMEAFDESVALTREGLDRGEVGPLFPRA